MDAFELIQVSVDIKDEGTRKRELDALEVAMNRFDRDESFVVTMDEEEDIELSCGIVHVVPAWKWLLR